MYTHAASKKGMLLSIIAVLALTGMLAQAGNYTWIGAAGSDWTNAT
jgi:hypothetical protein